MSGRRLILWIALGAVLAVGLYVGFIVAANIGVDITVPAWLRRH